MKKLLNKYFPYIVFFLTGLIIFLLTKPKESDITNDLKAKNDSIILSNQLYIDSLLNVIKIRDTAIDSVIAKRQNKETEIKYKIIYNEKKYYNIDNLSNDSTIILFHTNFR